MSCSCADKLPNFVKASNDKYVDLVVMVKILSYENYYVREPKLDTFRLPMSVKVEVIKIYKGQQINREIKIFSGTGYDCIEPVHHFKTGEYYIMAFPKPERIERESGIVQTDKDYFIPSCGEYIIKYDPRTDIVKGRIKDNNKKIKSIRLVDFETFFAKYSDKRR